MKWLECTSLLLPSGEKHAIRMVHSHLFPEYKWSFNFESVLQRQEQTSRESELLCTLSTRLNASASNALDDIVSLSCKTQGNNAPTTQKNVPRKADKLE